MEAKKGSIQTTTFETLLACFKMNEILHMNKLMIELTKKI